MVLFVALLLSFTLTSSANLKQDETMSDFINNFAGTPGSENFMEKSVIFKSNKPKAKKEKAAKTKKTKKNKKKKKKTLKRPKLDATKIYHKGWLKISSYTFRNTKRFPPLATPTTGDFTIKVTKKQFRINEDFDKDNKKGPPSKTYFWFRLSGRHLYYSPNAENINVLDNILIRHIKFAFTHDKFSKLAYCFKVSDVQGRKYTLCAKNLPDRNKWICLIQKSLGHPQDPVCQKKKKGMASTPSGQFVLRTITQPLIIIPQPSAQCNENWDYIGNGRMWECECKEGKEQSPIDLPPPVHAIASSVKPIFHYDNFSPESPSDFQGGLVKKGENIKIRLVENALRIYHPNMGKVVTIDGSSYTAEEIVFHTPAEHTIKGERFDMEMQVIHRGTTQGDIAKNVVLSILFKKKAGNYNKFLDKIDPFNLPNPHETYREITEELYIPHVFSNVDEPNIPIMKPFSFYTYQGSLTAPPCSERTIVYVASKPIFLSSTTLEMFKEALKMPDMMSSNGDVQVSNKDPKNNRDIQKLHGRAVFFYDTEKFCGPSLLDGGPSLKVRPRGHYEKKISKITEYIHINSENPSGLPGAFVVSEREAKGIRLKKQKKKKTKKE
jgi:carbonic anhydrase